LALSTAGGHTRREIVAAKSKKKVLSQAEKRKLDIEWLDKVNAVCRPMFKAAQDAYDGKISPAEAREISRAADKELSKLKRELKELQKKTGVYGRVTIRLPKKKSVAKP
jgi:hypothetical protein